MKQEAQFAFLEKARVESVAIQFSTPSAAQSFRHGCYQIRRILRLAGINVYDNISLVVIGSTLQGERK